MTNTVIYFSILNHLHAATSKLLGSHFLYSLPTTVHKSRASDTSSPRFTCLNQPVTNIHSI